MGLKQKRRIQGSTETAEDVFPEGSADDPITLMMRLCRIGGALVSLSENNESSFEARGFLQAGAGITRDLGDALVIGAEASVQQAKDSLP